MQKDMMSVLGNLLTTAVSSGGKQQGTIESRIAEVDSEKYDFQIYLPPPIEKQKNLPVMIFLHGIRERGSGGFVPTGGAAGMIARHYFSQVPAIVLLPQCRPGSYWSDPKMDAMVMCALAQTVEKFSANEQRVSLVGVSMGGYGVWHLAFNHPNKFAALVSICGGSSIQAGERFTRLARAVGKTPARLYHGADDTIVQVSESRQIFAALKENGGDVKYTEYPNVGHHVWLNVLGEKDLLPWILAQRLESGEF